MKALPEKYRKVIEGMRDINHLAGQRYQKQHWRAVREGAHPDIVGGSKPGKARKGLPTPIVECRGFELVLRRRMEALGVPMFAHCIWRDNKEQARLKAEGFSKAGPGQSAHNYGCAVDFIHSVKGWELTPEQWQVVGHVGHEVAKSLGLHVVWGGDDPGVDDEFDWDPAHWELRDWREVRATMQVHPSIKTVPQALAQVAREVSGIA